MANCEGNVPVARIVQSLLPVRGAIAKTSANHINRSVMRVNQELKATAQQHGLSSINLDPVFCDAKGEIKAEYSDEGVHPNRKGCDAWVRLLTEHLKQSRKAINS